MTAQSEPRVWLGCLACYNAGRLVGEWMSPDIAADATPAEVHTLPADRAYMERDQREGFGEHEELWVMDHEYVPLTDEFGPIECRAIADAWDVVGEFQWDAFVAYSRTGLGGMDGSGVSDPSDFEEAYAGNWDSFRDYADEFADEQIECYVQSMRDPYGTRVSRDEDDFLVRYFDYAAFARDLEHDYSVVDAPDGGVYVFRSY